MTLINYPISIFVYSDIISFNKSLLKYAGDSRDFSNADLDPLIDIREKDGLDIQIYPVIVELLRGESISRV